VIITNTGTSLYSRTAACGRVPEFSLRDAEVVLHLLHVRNIRLHDEVSAWVCTPLCLSMMTAYVGSGTAGLLVPQVCTSPSLALLACPYITFISLGVLRSCCFLPESVGVGSSGALMGMLSSWVVWIIFRWYVGVFFSVCDLRAAFHCRFMPVMTTLCRGQLVRNPELTHSVFALQEEDSAPVQAAAQLSVVHRVGVYCDYAGHVVHAQRGLGGTRGRCASGKRPCA
jgi:hypothetical protein